MAEDRTQTDRYEQQLIAMYVAAEAALLAGTAKILRATVSTADGALSARVRIRKLMRSILSPLMRRTDPLVERLIASAVLEGEQAAIESAATLTEQMFLTSGQSLDSAGGGNGSRPPGGGLDAPFGDEPFDLSKPHGTRAAEAIRRDITSELQDVRFRITRLPDDIYKHIAPHGAIYQALANGVTPAQAQAMAWRVFQSSGVTGFTDKSGRDWTLSNYVEMAVRTAATRAYNDSHLARMKALGIHYYSVADDGNPCPYCFPWQGAVLTDGVVTNPLMHVDGTIAIATAAGLFHPNCRHALIAVQPGFTVLPPREQWTPERQAAYALSQKQRRLEVEVRKARARRDHAIDAKTRAEANEEFVMAQAKVRNFVRDNDLSRQPRREQNDLTDAYIKLPNLRR